MGDEYMNRMDNFLATKESQIEALVNKKLEIEDKIVVDRLEMAKVEKEMWIATAKNDQRGMDCNAAGPCDLGEPDGMVPIEVSAEDNEKLKNIVQDFVLKRWAKRCGTQKCVDEWNSTLGELSGLKASL